MTKRTIEDAIEELQNLLDTQTSDGNWNHDNYNHGMANGMLLAMSILKDSTPEFLNAPDIFLHDIKMLDRFNESSIVLHNESDNDTDS